MKIGNNKVVALTYELNVDGQMVDFAKEDKPLEFIQGMGCLLPLFEKNIEGKEPGEAFAFTLDPENGYGEWSEANIIDLPKSAFEVDGTIREDLMVVGSIVPLMNQAGGVIPAKVVEVHEECVKMDLNHPMAGKTLNFTGKIVSVRDATEKELSEGLHGEFSGHHECSGHCHGNCGGCEDDGCHHGEGGCKEEGGKKEGGCCGRKGHCKEK